MSAATARPFGIKPIAYVVFVLMAILVFFGRDIQLFQAGSELRQRYAHIPWWMLAHGVFGAMALFIGPFQFAERFRRNHLSVHRLMGRLYVVGAIVSSLTAVPIAIILGPPELIPAATIQSIGWMSTTLIALYCIRTGRVAEHREWMIRSFPFAMVFLVARVLLAVPPIGGLGLLGLIVVVWSTIALAAFLPSVVIALRATLAKPARR